MIVDAFDNAASRQVVQDFARKAEIPCLHVGLFEDYGEVIWDAEYRVPADVDGDVCEYPLARNIILLAVSVASESVLRFVGEGATKGFSITLRDLKIQEI